MSAHLILSDDWAKYDEFKRATGRQPDIFHPDDAWEVQYLLDIARSHYPQYTDMAIRLSVSSVKRTLYAGCKRQLFVQLVVDNLTQRKPFVPNATELC